MKKEKTKKYYNYVFGVLDEDGEELRCLRQIPYLNYDPYEERDLGLVEAGRLKELGYKRINCISFLYSRTITMEELRGIMNEDPSCDHLRELLVSVNTVIPMEPMVISVEELVGEIAEYKKRRLQ